MAIRSWNRLPEHFMRSMSSRAFLVVVLLALAATSIRAEEPAPPDPTAAVTAALRRYVDAQVKGDADAMLAACATAGVPPEALAATRSKLSRFLAAFPVEAAEVVPLGSAIAPGGEVAAVRFAYTSRVGGHGHPADQAGGAIASLVQQDGGWLVAGLTVDEPVTTDVFDCVSAAAPPSGPLASPRRPPPGSVYVDLDALAKALEKVKLRWHIDDDKAVMDQAMSLTGIGVTGIGDVISSGYTLKERMQTLARDLPNDVKRGNVGATLLDIALVGWGVVQIAAEVVPGADSATDQLEMVLEMGRYNFIQREGYLRLRRELERRDFSGLPRITALRWVKDFPPEEVRIVAAPEWYGFPKGLAHLRFMGDALHQRRKRLVFDVFVQVPIARGESEDLFEMARILGMPLQVDRPPGDPVALLKVRLTPLVTEVTKRPVADRVLTDWRLAQGTQRRITCRLEPQPGHQNVVFRLSDGSETQRVVVANHVYNALTGVAVRTAEAGDAKALALPLGQAIEDAKLVGELPAEEGAPPQGPDLTGLPWVHVEAREPGIAAIEVKGTWPAATLSVRAQSVGSTILRITLDGDGDTVEAKSFEIPVTVSAAAPSGAESMLFAPEIELYGYVNPSFTAVFDHTWNDPPDVLEPGRPFDLRVAVKTQELEGAIHAPTIAPLTGVNVLGGRSLLEQNMTGPSDAPSKLTQPGMIYTAPWGAYYQARAYAQAGGPGWQPGMDRPAEWKESDTATLDEKIPDRIKRPDGTVPNAPVAGELLQITHWATLSIAGHSGNYVEVNRLYVLQKNEDAVFRWHLARRWTSKHTDAKDGTIAIAITPNWKPTPDPPFR